MTTLLVSLATFVAGALVGCVYHNRIAAWCDRKLQL